MSGLTSGISLGVVSKRTPLVDNSAPSGAVASLVATTNGPDSIALTWTAKAGARRYRVERSLNGSTGWALVDYPTTNSFIDTGLALATEYFYRVRAQNAAGAAAYSSTANATTLGQVANLAAVAVSASEIDLTWDADAAATAYQVERSPDGVTWGAPASAGSISYHSTGLDAETEYFYRARSTSAGDPGPFSATANATTQAAAVGGFALADLVAGWALTAGSQQTLSSAGVVASGPLDLTEDGTITYGTDGAVFTGVTGQMLSHATSAALEVADDPFLVACEFIVNSVGQAQMLVNKGDGDDEFALYVGFQLDTGLPAFYVAAGDSGYPNANDGGYSVPTATRQVFMAWHDPATTTIGLQANVRAPVTNDAVTAGQPATATHFSIGAYRTGATNPQVLDGKIRHVRLWKGANAAVLAADATFLAWLANSGNGRTDAELAAYTP